MIFGPENRTIDSVTKTQNHHLFSTFLTKKNAHCHGYFELFGGEQFSLTLSAVGGKKGKTAISTPKLNNT